MEKQKTKISGPESLQLVQQNLHESPADSELRRKLMDDFVRDAPYGRFVRTTLPFYNPVRIPFPYNLTRYIPEGITRRELGTIKLTAQFMAVFGIFFQLALFDNDTLRYLQCFDQVSSHHFSTVDNESLG